MLGGETREEIPGRVGLPGSELGEAAEVAFRESQPGPSRAARRPNNQQHHVSLRLCMTRYLSNFASVKTDLT